MRLACRTAACLALALALFACGDDDDDALAAGRVADVLDSGGELSRLAGPLQASDELLGKAPDVARALQLLRAREAFERLNPECVTVTAGVTFLDVTFARCRVPPLPFQLAFTLDGSLRAEVSIEAAGGFAVRLVTAVTLSSLEVTGPLRSRRLSGGFELRQAILAGGAPTEVEGELGLATDGGEEVGVSLSASWAVTGACVTYTASARLSDDPLGELGPITLSGTGVQRCRSECPTAGSVELSYGPGTLLLWTYTGEDTVTVIGPRGKRLEVSLPCGGEG